VAADALDVVAERLDRPSVARLASDFLVRARFPPLVRPFELVAEDAGFSGRGKFESRKPRNDGGEEKEKRKNDNSFHLVTP
jgi:hypothetical protein